MFLLKDWEIEIQFFVIIIHEDSFSGYQKFCLFHVCLSLHQEAPPPTLEKFHHNSTAIPFLDSHSPGL